MCRILRQGARVCVLFFQPHVILIDKRYIEVYSHIKSI